MLKTAMHAKYCYPTIRDEVTEAEKVKPLSQGPITSKYEDQKNLNPSLHVSNTINHYNILT